MEPVETEQGDQFPFKHPVNMSQLRAGSLLDNIFISPRIWGVTRKWSREMSATSATVLCL